MPQSHRRLFPAVSSALSGAALLALSAAAGAGTWVPLTHNAPGPISLMILLSDGTVMASAQDGNTIGRGWYRLTPDVHGSYANGTWSNLASMIDTRLYFSSQLRQDGRLFVAGGEYGTGGAKAEIYDPTTNAWVAANPPSSIFNPSQSSPVGGNQQFYDSISAMIYNGDILVAPVFPKTSGGTLLLKASGAWATGPKTVNGAVYQDEASWINLADNSVLTVDPFGTKSERYIPATNTWVADGNVPVSLYDPFGFELGAGFLLANGKAFLLGSTGHTAIYTPSGSASPGVWTAGPDIPGSHGTPDAPACMLTTGNILCAVSPLPTSADHFPSPVTFYEYNPTSNSFVSEPAPQGSIDDTSTFTAQMLALPNGGVMYSHFGNDVYIYTPSGAPLPFKPVINSITQIDDRDFQLTGVGLNGISQGAAYGDDAQMATNYPIVQLSSGNGNIYYARTSNWTSSGVQTGSQVITVNFRLPANIPGGQYSVVEVANQYPSDPFATQITAPPPVGPGAFTLSSPAPGATGIILNPTLDWSDSSGAVSYVVTLSTNADLSSPLILSTVSSSQLVLTPGTLQQGVTYYWGVVASNSDLVTTVSTPAIGAFTTVTPPAPCPGDLTGDKHVDSVDLGILLSAFGSTVTPPGSSADLNADGVVNSVDLGVMLSEFGRTDCP